MSGETRYVKVPAAVEEQTPGVFLAWVNADRTYSFMSCADHIYGRGATEEQAFSDLLKKLGYEEVRT